MIVQRDFFIPATISKKTFLDFFVFPGQITLPDEKYGRYSTKKSGKGYNESRLIALKSWTISPTSLTPNAVCTTFISSWRAQSAM